MQPRQTHRKAKRQVQRPEEGLSFREVGQHKTDKSSFQLNKNMSKQGSEINNKDLYAVVGVLWSYWENSKNKVIAKNVGTAFAITPQLLITCTHNVFSHKIATQYASSLIFYPGIEGIDAITQKTRHYKGVILGQKSSFKKISFDVRPIPEQLTVILLEKRLQGVTWFPSIGNLQMLPFFQERQIRIIGYPLLNNPFVGSNPSLRAESYRKDLKGKLHSIEDHEVNYFINTSKGQSGSPVMTQNPKGQYIVVGIHTHAGMEPGINAGVHFSDNILKQLKKLEQCAKQTKQYKIKYYSPEEHKQKAFEVKENKIVQKQEVIPFRLDVKQILQVKSISEQLSNIKIEGQSSSQQKSEMEEESNKSQMDIYDDLVFQITGKGSESDDDDRSSQKDSNG